VTSSNAFRHRHAVTNQPAPIVKRPGQYPPKQSIVVPTTITATWDYSSLSCPVTIGDLLRTDEIPLFSPSYWQLQYTDSNGHAAQLGVLFGYLGHGIYCERQSNEGGGYIGYAKAFDDTYAGQWPYTSPSLAWQPMACNASGHVVFVLSGSPP
jgi:hypothetical protein